MLKTFIMVWIEEEEKWYYFKEKFDETVFVNGYIDYYIEIDDNTVIVNDSFKQSNIGKDFVECYNLSLWEHKISFDKILKNETLKELIDLYEFDIISYSDTEGIKLYDKQLDEYITMYKDGLISYFSTDSRHRYSSDGDLFHLEQARELEKILLEA